MLVTIGEFAPWMAQETWGGILPHLPSIYTADKE
jgi:hypothetical protein